MLPHKVVCFGELLWDVLPAGAKPGGAPMNVGYHLQKLGMNPAVITRIGKDKWGDDLKRLLNEQRVSIAYIQTDEQNATGLVHATLKENNEVAYDIVYPVAWDFIEWRKEFAPLLEQAGYFVFGSLAARNDVSRTTLFHLLEAAPVKVLDINLRPPHFTQAFVAELLTRADILKLNDHEVKLISGWFKEYYSINDQINLIQDEFSIDTILVTRGDKGAIINQQGAFVEHKGFKVTVADTVGSGDAFLAGYLYKTSNGCSVEESIGFANALGAFIATKSGACPEYDLAEVDKVIIQSA